MNQYSIMLHDRKHLIIKTHGNQQPFVIAEVFLPEVAETICELLTKAELEKQNDSNE